MERPAGLVNTGNSCYLSSTLQALGSSPSFVEYLSELQAAVRAAAPPRAEPGGQAAPGARWGLAQLGSAVAAAVLGFLVGERAGPPSLRQAGRSASTCVDCAPHPPPHPSLAATRRRRRRRRP
jgi:hypothetical protein